MRAAVLTSHLTRSGGGLFEAVCSLSRNLSAQGVTLEVLGLANPLDEDLHAWAPLCPQTFPIVGPPSVGWSPKLHAALDHLDADLAHCHGLWTDVSRAGLRWAKRTGKPYVISPHGMLDPWALQRSRVKKRIAGFLFQNAYLRRAACIHALCEPEAEAIRHAGWRNPICVIPNGVDLPTEREEQPPCWKDSVPRGENVLFYLGRLHPKKGLANLLRAWRIVENDAARWHLVIAGWDQSGHEAELKALAHELGAPRVHFPGPQFGAAKAAAFRACDAFVLPSFSEGLPMVVLEAWAHAKPILMTDECNLPEGFASGAAIAIDTQPDRTVNGLRELFSQNERARIDMGARGRKLVEARFTWSTVAREMRGVYQWLTNGGSPPACVHRD